MNRIQQAYSSGSKWGETFGPTATNPGVPPSSPGIDAWGNLTNRSGVNGKNNYEPLSCPADGQNHLTTCSLTYDAAGNVTGYGTSTYTYDAENRMIATAGMSYVYDGDGNRVGKCTQGTTPGACATNATGTLYWTGIAGAPLVETDLAGNVQENYILFNGQRLARRDASPVAMHYYFSDHLGTHSLITDANGTMPPQEESDYYPYGGEIHLSGSDPNHYKFTGKERDTESGLDYFGARHDASALGRFMSVDPALESEILEHPQTWNRYSYVYNNPLRFTDPDGRCPNCLAAGAGFLVGGLIGGGIDLGIQLYHNGGHLGDVTWSEVGANAAQDAVAGGIAGFTLGGGLVADILVGGAANTVGGVVKRGIANQTYDPSADPFSTNDAGADFVAGMIGGGLAYGAASRAKDLIDAPIIGPRPSTGVRYYSRKLAAYNQRIAANQMREVETFVIGTSIATPAVHGIGSWTNGFGWLSLYLDGLQPHVSTRVVTKDIVLPAPSNPEGPIPVGCTAPAMNCESN
jgi:RHS repeat-associated protein